MRRFLLVPLLLLLGACRLILLAPDTAGIDSKSSAYDCPAQTECPIDVVDFFFKDTFRAAPEAGYHFDGWRAAPGYACGGRQRACKLDSSLMAADPLLVDILRSDTALYLSPNIRADFYFESLPCDQVPATSPINPGETARVICSSNWPSKHPSS